jgi:hypothetical protein
MEMGEALPPSLHNRIDDGRYLVDLIMWQTATGRADEKGYVSLHASFLDKVMAKSNRAHLVEAMIGENVLERSPYYQIGAKSYGYRLHCRFARDHHTTTAATDRRLIRAIGRARDAARERQAARWLPVHFALAERQYGLRIDIDEAEEIISGLPAKSNPYDVQRILVRNIDQGMYRLSVGKWGRVSNSITSLKREVRSALRYKGQKLRSADLKCSQPAFLGQETNQPITNQTHNDCRFDWSGGGCRAWESKIPDDLARFVEATSEGVFYEVFAELMAADGHPAMERNKIKEGVLKDVIAKAKPCNTKRAKASRRKAGNVDAVLSGAEYPSIVEDTFRRHFPTTYRFIRQANKDGWEHQNVIRLLTMRESGLVIHRVASGLMSRQSRLILTLHDSIFTPADSIHHAEREFRDAFAERKIKMQLKIE